MYSVRDFGAMIGDEGRFEAYSRAIAAAVRPGDAVMEIGCGPAVFALLACRAGARKVYAVEIDEVIDLGCRLAAANGFGDRIEFIQNDSRKINLPEPVNLIVSDIRGVLPLYGSALGAIEDARVRILAKGGILIPQRDELKAAIVESHKLYCELTSPWKIRPEELDLSLALPLTLNETHNTRIKPENLLTEAQTWWVLDYAAGANSRAKAETVFQATRNGLAEGICLWFDTDLYQGIGYSSGPQGTGKVYGQLFLPFLSPITLAKGQEISVRLQADLVGESYIWSWDTKFDARDGSPKIHFRQSSFEGASISHQSLQRHATSFVPTRTEQVQAESMLLEEMDGKNSLEEIARKVSEKFPKTYPRMEDALRRVMELSRRFSV